MSLPSHFAVATDPVASATAQVSAGSYRVTVLGDRLVRVEYDKRGRFEDRASQVVWFRRFEPPAFHVTRRGASLEVDTGEMVVAIDHDTARRRSRCAISAGPSARTTVPEDRCPLETG